MFILKWLVRVYVCYCYVILCYICISDVYYILLCILIKNIYYYSCLWLWLKLFFLKLLPSPALHFCKVSTQTNKMTLTQLKIGVKENDWSAIAKSCGQKSCNLYIYHVLRTPLFDLSHFPPGNVKGNKLPWSKKEFPVFLIFGNTI